MPAIFYNIIMNIIYKIANIIFSIFFTLIITSIISHAEYFMINDTIFFRILSILTLISLWLPIFIRTNIYIISICIFIFIVYFVLYISHPLL